MKIIVTGGAGFIGSHITDRLLKEKNQVLCIDNFDNFYDIKEKQKNIESHLKNRDYKLAEGDITDKNFISKTINDFLPEATAVRPSINTAELYYHSNVTGTLNLLEAIKDKKNIKFIFTSSSSVYGLNTKVPFEEKDSILNPASPYASTKIAGESLCFSYHYNYKIPVVILRLFSVYGTRQRPDLAVRKFIERICRGEEISVFGDGGTSRDYTHVYDITDGFCRALDYTKKSFDIFNLGNSEPVKLIDLIGIIQKVSGIKPRIRYENFQQGDVPITYADISKARKILGYKPTVELKTGISEMVDWVQGKL